MTRAKGKAIKKATTLGGEQHEGPPFVTGNPIFVGGNTIKELSSLINGLPEDMAIALEDDQSNTAFPIAFDRVVTAMDQRGESQQVAFFRQVTKESLGKMKTKAAGMTREELFTRLFVMEKNDFDKAAIETHSGLELGITVFKRPKDMDTAVTDADKLGTIRPTPKGAVFVKKTRRALTAAENIAIQTEVAACSRAWAEEAA